MVTIFFVTALLIGALNYAMPQLTRRDIFFGVTVAPQFRATPQARAILAGYRRGIVGVTLAISFLFYQFGATITDLDGGALLMLELFACVGVLVLTQRRTMPFRARVTSTREASLAPQPLMPALIPLLAGPYLILGLATLTLVTHWAQVPDPMPVHWDLVGNPNGWMPKKPAILWTILAAYLVMCVVCSLIVIGMVYFSRQISASGAPAREERRFRWIGVAVTMAAGYLTASLAFLPLFPHVTIAFGGIAAVLVAVIIGALELVRRGQGGERLAVADSSTEAISDRTPDACWIWGIFYYNPEDPALMVEKRFGIGWTLNFAHRGAWAFMILIFVALAFSLSLPLLARL